MNGGLQAEKPSKAKTFLQLKQLTRGFHSPDNGDKHNKAMRYILEQREERLFDFQELLMPKHKNLTIKLSIR